MKPMFMTRREPGAEEPRVADGARRAPTPDGPAARQDPEVSAKPVRRRFTAEYKRRILRTAERCSKPGEIGALLRREGLYSTCT